MIVGLLAASVVILAGAALKPALPRRDEIGRGRCAEPPTTRPTRPTPTGPHRRRAPTCGPDEVARWCTDLARATRSGATLTAALRSTTAPDAATESVASLQLALARGHALGAALEQAAGASPAPDLRLALTVLQACAVHGGPPGEPLDRAASTLRARAADHADRRTHSAQARMSAVVMTCLPVAMLTLLLATSAPVRTIVATPVGVLTIGAGAVLNLAGWRWMSRIIGRHQ